MTGGPTRVLYVVPFAHLGGAETWIRHTARFHDRACVRPVYAFLRPGALVEQVRATGAEVLSLSPPLGRLTPWAAARVTAWLWRIIGATNPDLVHASLAYAAVLAGPAAHARGIPFVWTQHGPVTGALHRVAGWQPAAGIFVNSDATAAAQARVEGRVAPLLHGRRAMMRLRYGIDPAELATTEDAEARAAHRARWGIPPDAFVAGIVCRLVPWKGVDVFVRAMSDLRRRRGPATWGVVIGEPPPRGDRHVRDLRLLCRRTRAPVVFAGPTSTPMDAIRGLDVLVNSSRAPEPFGITLLEGMALSRVVVAPAAGGPLELIRDGDNGLLFQSGDPASLARVLERAARPESRGLGERARSEVLRHFLQPAPVRDLERCYAALLRGEVATAPSERAAAVRRAAR